MIGSKTIIRFVNECCLEVQDFIVENEGTVPHGELADIFEELETLLRHKAFPLTLVKDAQEPEEDN